MNLILLSNKWLDQKVRQGLAKIEKKAFGEKFFCRCRNGRNGRMAPCPKKKNESQSTKDGDETLLCTSRHTLIVTHTPTCLHTRTHTYSFTHRHTHMHTHAHPHTHTRTRTHMHTSTNSLMPWYTHTPHTHHTCSCTRTSTYKCLYKLIAQHSHTHSNTTNFSSLFFSDVATISIGSLSVFTSNTT